MSVRALNGLILMPRVVQEVRIPPTSHHLAPPGKEAGGDCPPVVVVDPQPAPSKGAGGDHPPRMAAGKRIRAQGAGGNRHQGRDLGDDNLRGRGRPTERPVPKAKRRTAETLSHQARGNLACGARRCRFGATIAAAGATTLPGRDARAEGRPCGTPRPAAVAVAADAAPRR